MTSRGLVLDIGPSHVKIDSMETKPAKSNPISPPSPSFHLHKKQRFWQILAPILVGGLATLGAAAWMVRAVVVGNSVSQYADTSLIWLILPVMMFGILFGLLLLGLIYAVAQLLHILPQYTFLVQQYAALIEAKLKLWTKKAMDPVITVESIKAAAGAFFKNLFAWVKK
jgi:hypothetical protein